MRLIEEYTTGYGRATVTLKAWLTMPSVDQPDLLASALRIDVAQASGFPADIFIWERQETMLDNGMLTLVVRPVCVAKPSDLSVYPAKAPVAQANGKPPFYRDNFLSFQIEAPELVIDTWANVKLDVGNLIKTVMQLGGPPA
jgi:hypothetical protein